MVVYAISVAKNKRNYLKNNIVELISTQEPEAEAGKEFTEFGANLYQYYISKCELDDLKKVAEFFCMYVGYRGKPIAELRIENERLARLVNKVFFEENLSKTEAFMADGEQTQNWAYLAENLDDSSELIEVLINYAYNNVEKVNVDTSLIGEIIGKMLPLLKSSENMTFLIH